ncbi:hypothetical protein pb186bvf_015589 [Paramecium bursaria]
MKFLALISGGKDSIFNIIRCIQEGHELVLLVNLYFAQQGVEKDSYMYQSVGSNIIQSVADAMQVPLLRRQIKGTPRVLNLEYEAQELDKQEDEVEDLYEVLKEAITLYPDIKGVSSGAICSTYQKLRVEDCCNRLGMTSLAYLWNLNQLELLQSMIQNGMDFIIIKVAAFGLSKDYLGKRVKDCYEQFAKMQQEFGFHPCGEGGEFESLTLDCPLYKKRFVIKEFDIVEHTQDKFAPVSYMIIKDFELVDK